MPFCAGKCAYCDFYSLTAPHLIPEWLRAVKKEAAAYTGLFSRFDTLYIGGGTPSVLPDEALASLLESLFRVFDFAPDAEVTLEVNPEHVTTARIGRFLEWGVNRISLGVQSFDDAMLDVLGRRHSAAEAADAARAVRDAGCGSLSLDLMYGLPAQGESEWFASLKRALEFDPEHLSCYMLTLEKGTRLERLKDQGRVIMPDEDALRSLFLGTSGFLEDRGYAHYEVSNFARGVLFEARHNRKYWRHAPYLGLGPSAHSFLNGVRWWNHRSIRRYAADLDRGVLPTAGREVLSEEQKILETVFLGLRTDQGVDLRQVLDLPDGPGKVDRLVDRSLARVDRDRLILTRDGLVMADHMAVLLTD